MSLIIDKGTNYQRLNTSLRHDARTQCYRYGPFKIENGDVLLCHGWAEVTSNEPIGDRSAMVYDQLFLSEDKTAVEPTSNWQVAGGPFTGQNTTNLTPYQHHFTFRSNGLIDGYAGTYYLIYVIGWWSDLGIDGTLETNGGIEVLRMRGVGSLDP